MDKPANNDLAIADMLAARATLDHRGVAHGGAGREAERGMETRERIAAERAGDLIAALVQDSAVLVGGGSAMQEASLAQRLDAAAATARARLFPKYKDADRPATEWQRAHRIGREGAENPFAAVGHAGEVETHPVARQILDKIGAGKTGADLRKIFERDPYGWPQDAIDAALVALVRANKLNATLNGEPAAASALDNPAIGKTTFRREDVVVSARDRLALRGLFGKLKIDAPNADDLGEPARAFLAELRRLGDSASGEAPLPAPPRLVLEDEAKALTGNVLLKHLFDRKAEIEKTIAAWQARGKLKDERLARWRSAARLARHAEAIPEAAGALIEIKAIEQGRLLLESHDPLPEPTTRLRQILVERVANAHRALTDRVREAFAGLDANPAWSALLLVQKESILGEVGLGVPSPVDTSTDAAIAEALDRRPLGMWQADIDAIPGRIARAAEKATRLTEPTAQTVHLERATLRTAGDVDAWLARQRERLLAALARGPALIG